MDALAKRLIVPYKNFASYELKNSSEFKRSLRVFAEGQQIANAVYLGELYIITNKHVCAHQEKARQYMFIDSKNNFLSDVKKVVQSDTADLCLIELNEGAIQKEDRLELLNINVDPDVFNKKVILVGYSYRASMFNSFFIFRKSTGETLEVMNLENTPGMNTLDFLNYFNNVITSTLPIVPGCSGSAIYDKSQQLTGIANAVSADGLGIFVPGYIVSDFLLSQQISHNRRFH